PPEVRMRIVVLLPCLIALGCARTDAGKTDETNSVRRDSVVRVETNESPPDMVAPLAAASAADLRTRKSGSDWPGFLGPQGNSTSTEKGILIPRPGQQLRVVWHKQVGTGYGMPSISNGRLFQFDRHGNQARLSCLKSETGDLLWQFEYPTEYEDYFGYNNGPRCSPVVDGNRVYIYGADGVLCCVRTSDGKRVWKVDSKAEFGVVQNFFGVGSTPVLEGDLLIVQV